MKDLFALLPEWLRSYEFSRYLSNNYVVVDFETTMIDFGSPYVKENRIVCSSFRYGKAHPDYQRGTMFVKDNEFGQQLLVSSIERADFWIAHNTKFESGWLERCGLPLGKFLPFCTMIAEYVLLSNRSHPSRISLSASLRRRNMQSKDDLGSKLLKARVCPSTWPLRILEKYSKGDVIETEKLFLRQRRALVHFKQLPVVFTRNIFTAPLTDIEKNGMCLDAVRVYKLTNDYSIRLIELQAQLDILTGGANPASPKQMREVLYEVMKFKKPKDRKWLTKTGEYTTAFDYINTLKATTKRQKSFKRLKQEWSKVNAALTKSLRKFSLCCDETSDQVLTAIFNQCVTVTQRTSSTGKKYGAQFQNFARIFKPLFKARRKGWKIGEVDQAQLEYRVAVWYGQDEAGMYDIEHEVDSHAFTASEIFGYSVGNLGCSV